MNIYLLLAFAFGAVTGVADAAVPRVAAVASIRVRAERRSLVSGRRSPASVVSSPGARRPETGDRFVAIAPLSGSISPRAPAVTC